MVKDEMWPTLIDHVLVRRQRVQTYLSRFPIAVLFWPSASPHSPQVWILRQGLYFTPFILKFLLKINRGLDVDVLLKIDNCDQCLL